MRLWDYDADSLKQNNLIFRIGEQEYRYKDFIEYETEQQWGRRYRSKEEMVIDLLAHTKMKW